MAGMTTPNFATPAVPSLLTVILRERRVESGHYGHLAIVSPDGETRFAMGGPQQPIYARSTLKPIQILPLFLTGAANAYGLPDTALAVGMASHAGQPMHVEAVDDLLARAGLSADQLQCGTHMPLHEPTAHQLIREGREPEVRQCNCSGKHAAMLAVCRHEGWSLETYRDPDHPLQRWIRELIGSFTDLAPGAIGYGVDGCGVPVWNLPLDKLALAFARLGEPDSLEGDLRAAVQRATTVMTRHPELISGPGRLDTELMRAGEGRLIAKIGGEGVHAGAVRGARLGWAMKVMDGNRRAIAPALASALAQLGHPIPVTEGLQTHLAPVVKNNRGEIVGSIEAAF
ncbi:L-asparaginase II [compost metagenome]